MVEWRCVWVWRGTNYTPYAPLSAIFSCRDFGLKHTWVLSRYLDWCGVYCVFGGMYYYQTLNLGVGEMGVLGICGFVGVYLSWSM